MFKTKSFYRKRKELQMINRAVSSLWDLKVLNESARVVQMQAIQCRLVLK